MDLRNTSPKLRTSLGYLALTAMFGASLGVVGCGDEMADASGNESSSGQGAGGPTGETVAVGPGADTTGVGQGPSSGTVGTGGGEPPPSALPPPPDEEVELVACDALDPESPVVLYLSADDSNSMASPAIAREALRAGFSPGATRGYEFLNYYDLGFPAPQAPDLGLFAEAELGDEPGSIDLLLAVRAHEALPRRPITMTFVMDTSGSMSGSPMDRQKAAGRAIASQLKAGDIASVVTWNTGSFTALSGHVLTGPDDPTLLGVIQALTADGGTDLDGGLRAGYQLAEAHYAPNRLNRVVLISDGGANVGVTEGSIIGAQSEDGDGEGIYLVGIGTGPISWYSDHLMDAVTDMGRGAYVYLDSVEEADRVLAQRFDEVFEIAARGVQVEVTLPWYFQMLRFYGEEWSEDPREVKPQHLAPGATTAILQTLRACSPDVVDLADPVRLRASWETPLTRQSRDAVLETTLGELLEGSNFHLAEAEAIVLAAAALGGQDQVELDAALARVDALADRQDPDLEELAELLRLAGAE